MNITFAHKNNDYQITRYPPTNNRSLRAWNAADEHLLQYLDDSLTTNSELAIYNDRFGFLTCTLHPFHPKVIVNYASQRKSILQNLKNNTLEKSKVEFCHPLVDLPKNVTLGLLKIPKSIDLFRLQLIQLTKALDANGVVLGGFMTKYFTPQILRVACEFFENVEQSRAWKKSRVITLKNPKPFLKKSIIHSITFRDQIFQQYFSVFSANNIDYASQFFITHLKVSETVSCVLDLASGNGVLAKMVRLKNTTCEIHLMDDSFLAIASSKLNLREPNTFFHLKDTLEDFEDNFFDLVISNPPFHFEHENNIDISIRLFGEVKRCLKPQGSFQLVANRHLNYKTHLTKIFSAVEIIAENKKFVIYECFVERRQLKNLF
ncbi:MAG: methyltransferase [Bacteroidota bacterium]